jgi:Tol biopolymer transport system component/tRNA A-37 threonylcarbamoyl transferase component Bud32
MVGKTISHYQITEKLGEGGMGVVYKAEDTRLKRAVALKFLRSEAIEDDEHRQRFIREAQAAAALDHANICTVYEIDEDDGQTFLSMAFLEGQTVKAKLTERPLKLDEALEIAIQTAQGLQAAHEKGIVHRDIKSANLIVTPQGHVKVMDFGLAQLAERSQLTKTATILGTPAYMSPEQAQRQPTDRRTDIWSLGVVLYEMATGRLPFEGERQEAVLFGITNEEPEPITALRAGLPMELEFIVGKALAKDREERYQHLADLIVDLRSLQRKLVAKVSTSTQVVAKGRTVIPQASEEKVSRYHRVQKFLIAVSVISISAAVAFGVLWIRSWTLAGERPRRSFAVRPQERAFWPVVSPDGRFVAYLTTPSAETAALWVHDLTEDKARIIAGPDETIWNIQPFWSPDGETLVFRSGNELKTIPVGRGAAATLCKFRGPVGPFGGSWAPDGGSIVFAHVGGLSQVPSEGGQAIRLREWPQGSRIRFGWPHFLPSGEGDRKLLYVEINRTGDGQIVAHDLDNGQRETLVSGYMPAYAPSGHIVYRKRDPAEIWAVPFSIRTMRTTGRPFVVSQNASRPSVGNDGTLVYVERAAQDLWAGLEQLVWRDRKGEHMGFIGQPQESTWAPALSPDEQRVAVRGHEGGPWSDIWIHEVNRPVKTLVSMGDGTDNEPTWSPGGDRIAFSSSSGFAQDVYVKAADGSGEAIPLVTSPDASEFVTDWGPRAETLVFTRELPREGNRRANSDIWYLKKKKAGEGYDELPFLQTQFTETAGQLSPDGTFLAYISNESGQYEVYLRSFPDGRQKQQVSINGGTQPRWRGDGKELFYVEVSTLMAVPVAAETGRVLASPQPLFSSEGLRSLSASRTGYDVTRDGERFVLAESVVEGSDSVRVVLNWFAEFRERQQR